MGWVGTVSSQMDWELLPVAPLNTDVRAYCSHVKMYCKRAYLLSSHPRLFISFHFISFWFIFSYVYCHCFFKLIGHFFPYVYFIIIIMSHHHPVNWKLHTFVWSSDKQLIQLLKQAPLLLTRYHDFFGSHELWVVFPWLWHYHKIYNFLSLLYSPAVSRR